jgi:MFS family permease
VPIFRALFIAQLGSNIGNWMETVAAQWLLVDHSNASTLVALVQTADMLPFMFLALPAGVLADIFDRRRYLMYVHLFLTAVAGLLAAATFAGIMRPALLLTLTFLEGAGSASPRRRGRPSSPSSFRARTCRRPSRSAASTRTSRGRSAPRSPASWCRAWVRESSSP